MGPKAMRLSCIRRTLWSVERLLFLLAQRMLTRASQEFGIDIVSDDNKTIVHHKVSTKIHIAVTAEEALTLMKCVMFHPARDCRR